MKIPTNRGQAIFFAAFFFLALSLVMTLGVSLLVESGLSSTRALARGNQSFFAAEAAAQDVSYRLMNGLSVGAVETLALGGASATATTTTTANGKEVASAGTNDNFVRTSKTALRNGSGAAFYYGVQAGAGGVILENTSSISGNLFSSGVVTGSGSNLIKGTVVSAGPSGKIEGVHATSSAYARIIKDSTIDKNAYYQTISGTSVGGTSYPGSADQATSTLPISDAQIAQWESDAAAGGTVSSPCPYKITANTTLGPKKINCDLEITNDLTVTLGGALWVVGNITIKNNAIIKLGSSLGAQSAVMIADNPSDQSNSSKISIKNSVIFQGSGTDGSYVMLVSQNNRAEQGGSGSGEEAIKVEDSASGKMLLYAGHGEILVKNSVSLKEATGYRIRLQNTAQVIYETGLANLLFTAGPSGGYTIDSWKETE